jgi:CubicO group peptidase (beta-lactamase class C family)
MQHTGIVNLAALTLAALTTLAAAAAGAQPLPRAATPDSVGFSAQRLQRVTDTFEADVRDGRIAGAVVLIMREGRIAYLQKFGYRDRSVRTPMQDDSIFRIASMTKPVTIVAALMLAEEGKLQLMDPASRYVSQLRQLQVGIEKVDANGERALTLEPTQREITVQDLMRHTSGMTYGPFGDSLVQRAYRAANTMDPQQTNAEMMDKLARLPLAYQPGSTFEYGMSTDVVGRIVEVVSGMDLNRFVAERIARPLHMDRTTFVLERDQVADLALPQANPGAVVPAYDAAHPPKWFSGGGGLLSTAEDYARFCQMLLNGGELDGVRLLSRKSVELMTADHLPPGIGYGPFAFELGLTAPLPQYGQGYGLGVGVRNEAGRSPVPGSVGDFFWGGATGPYFWVDPREKLVAVMMLQESDSQRRIHYRSVLRSLVYQALN